MQFLKREREVWKSPCCHPLLSTYKNISLLQNLRFLHPLVVLYVLFIVHLFVFLPRGSHFSDSCRIFWTLLCISTSEAVFKVSLDGLFLLRPVCSQQHLWEWRREGEKAAAQIFSSFKHKCHGSLVRAHVKAVFQEAQCFPNLDRGGDVFAFLGQILANCEHSGESESLDPFREVIAHFPKIPDTFCQNYPIPDHLNWACDMLKIYLRLLHVSNENKDKWTDVSQIFLNPCDVGRNDFYLSNRFRPTYDFLCNTSLSPSCCNVMLFFKTPPPLTSQPKSI